MLWLEDLAADGDYHGLCIDAIKVFIGNAVTNLITDVIVLCMPIPMI